MHVEYVSELPSFLRLNNIPLYGIYHILFTNSFVDASFSCFYFLAIVKIAAENIAVQVYEDILLILWGTYLK